MSQSAQSKRLQKTLNELMERQRDDLRLRDHLEGLRRDEALPGLTWFWGPELYRRNRVVFREIILAHFSEYEQERPPVWRRIPWSKHGERLEVWLASTRRNRDVWLAKKLWSWKFAKGSWGVEGEAWRRELLREHQAASGPAAQGVVLQEFDFWAELDEPTALALYSANCDCVKFVLGHLPTRFWGDEVKRVLWRKLFAAARAAGDDDLAFALYRRQIDLKEWQKDALELASRLTDPDQLNAELRKRHPEGWAHRLGDGAIALLRMRGRDVTPYVREKLDSFVGEWRSGSPTLLLKLARERGCWDLWAAVARSALDPKVFNDAIRELLDDAALDDAARVERLRALAGVSREWNQPGLGLARVHAVQDRLATRLYKRYPALVHGPFKLHVAPTVWESRPELLAAAQTAGDDELVDLLAGRYLTRVEYGPAIPGKWVQAGVFKIVDDLAVMYETLRDHDEGAFSRRAANVLTQIPAHAIHGCNQLLKTNRLARLLFLRSFSAFLSEPGAVRDLIEGSEIHVQMMGYRVLGLDDDRARAMAVEALEILVGTLLRPLHRKTRLAAFGALANAARGDAAAAARVLARARDALRLPDKRYPKEQLVGLIGGILHQRPDLRGPREHPRVYGLEEALA